MGSANFAVSFYTGWPHSLDSETRQLGDIGRNPPRLGRMYAGRGHYKQQSRRPFAGTDGFA